MLKLYLRRELLGSQKNMKYFLRKSTLGLVSVSAAFLIASSVDQVQVQSEEKQVENFKKEDNVAELRKQADNMIINIEKNSAKFHRIDSSLATSFNVTAFSPATLLIHTLEKHNQFSLLFWYINLGMLGELFDTFKDFNNREEAVSNFVNLEEILSHNKEVTPKEVEKYQKIVEELNKKLPNKVEQLELNNPFQPETPEEPQSH